MLSKIIVVVIAGAGAVVGVTSALWGPAPQHENVAAEAQMESDDGFVSLLPHTDEGYSNVGWEHFGPGGFTFDPATGELEGRGGMGLHWFSAREYSDFVLELDFKTSMLESNSGVFVRVPGRPTNNDYIYESFEIQIYDAGEGIHQTGAVYDAEASTRMASKAPGEWNHYRITCQGRHITVELNGETVVDWPDMEPRGKVKSLAPSGYIGLQNHDQDSSIWFRNVRVKELADGEA